MGNQKKLVKREMNRCASLREKGTDFFENAEKSGHMKTKRHIRTEGDGNLKIE